MDSEIVSIGDEITRGEIVDTNSAFFAEQLTECGFAVRWKSTCTDNAADIRDTLERATGRTRLVVVSGGLGPTEDDRTVDVIAQIMGVEPVVDGPSQARMEERFAARGFAMTPNNIRQVRVPQGAEVMPNRAG